MFALFAFRCSLLSSSASSALSKIRSVRSVVIRGSLLIFATNSAIFASVASRWSRCGECPHPAASQFRPRNFLNDRVHLRACAVLVLFSLNAQHRAADRVEIRLDIPLGKLGIEPDVVPCPRTSHPRARDSGRAWSGSRSSQTQFWRHECWPVRTLPRRHAALRGSAPAPSRDTSQQRSARSILRRCARAIWAVAIPNVSSSSGSTTSPSWCMKLTGRFSACFSELPCP